MEINNLSEAQFKTLVISLLKELSENLRSTKKDPISKKELTN